MDLLIHMGTAPSPRTASCDIISSHGQLTNILMVHVWSVTISHHLVILEHETMAIFSLIIFTQTIYMSHFCGISSQIVTHLGVSSFSRMRSEGSRFTWGSGGEAVFAKSCVSDRNRSQPSATVRNRLCVRRKALHSGECVWSGPESVSS